jgi:hypothetical protein
MPSTYSAISAASNNATVVKATPGKVYRVQVGNNNAAIRYLKLYEKATAPAPASDTPVLRYVLPAASSQQIAVDRHFAAGIAFVIVTGGADTNNDSTGATEVFVNFDYD